MRLSGSCGIATLTIVLSFSALALPARAQDLIYGGDARAYSMGGAGLALMHGSSSRPNPASLAFETKTAQPTFPTLGFRSTAGVSKDTSGGFLVNGLKNSDATALARDFGGQDSEFGVNGALGFRYANFEIGASAIGVGRLQPNPSLQLWVNTGQRNFNALPADAKGDIYAAGYYNIPSVAYGQAIPVPGIATHQVGVGIRVKAMTGVYTHYIADQRALLGLDPSKLAPEMNGEKTLTKKGIGADLGVLIAPKRGVGFSGAVVIANAIHPNFSFDGTDRDGNSTRVNLLKTTVGAGVGYQSKFGTTVVADMVDLTGETGTAQFRAGIEQRIWGQIYLRGGYNSVTGTTYGASAYGLDIAIGKRVPLEVLKTINF